MTVKEENSSEDILYAVFCPPCGDETDALERNDLWGQRLGLWGVMSSSTATETSDAETETNYRTWFRLSHVPSSDRLTILVIILPRVCDFVGVLAMGRLHQVCGALRRVMAGTSLLVLQMEAEHQEFIETAAAQQTCEDWMEHWDELERDRLIDMCYEDNW